MSLPQYNWVRCTWGVLRRPRNFFHTRGEFNQPRQSSQQLRILLHPFPSPKGVIQPRQRLSQHNRVLTWRTLRKSRPIPKIGSIARILNWKQLQLSPTSPNSSHRAKIRAQWNFMPYYPILGLLCAKYRQTLRKNGLLAQNPHAYLRAMLMTNQSTASLRKGYSNSEAFHSDGAPYWTFASDIPYLISYNYSDIRKSPNMVVKYSAIAPFFAIKIFH